MSEFDDIRPYRDEEVAGVLADLIRDEYILKAMSHFVMPRLSSWVPGFGKFLLKRRLLSETSSVEDIAGFQMMMGKYFERMMQASVQHFTREGLEQLKPDKGYLFISNHRDIALDSAFLNYALLQADLKSSRIAIGDNLLHSKAVSDLMRLNKSFIIPRNVQGIKKAYASMLKTSRYIRHSIEEGESIWIAQREGRSKDGFDRTDIALVKMLGLAFRKESSGWTKVMKTLNIVPVSISYELDPCDLLKACELQHKEHNDYVKSEGADLESIVTGITGIKGRVHLEFGEPLPDCLENPEQVVQALDRAIVGGLKIFATHRYALSLLKTEPNTESSDASVPNLFLQRLATCPELQKPYLLSQYANVIRNKDELAREHL